MLCRLQSVLSVLPLNADPSLRAALVSDVTATLHPQQDRKVALCPRPCPSPTAPRLSPPAGQALFLSDNTQSPWLWHFKCHTCMLHIYQTFFQTSLFYLLVVTWTFCHHFSKWRQLFPGKISSVYRQATKATRGNPILYSREGKWSWAFQNRDKCLGEGKMTKVRGSHFSNSRSLPVKSLVACFEVVRLWRGYLPFLRL